MIAVRPSTACESGADETCRAVNPSRPWTWCDGCRSERLVERVRIWLRHKGVPEVLSLTCYDEGGGAGAPDRRYDPVAAEADLERALAALPPLERTACQLSKGVDRSERGWFGWVNNSLRKHVGPQWVAWQDDVYEHTPRLADGTVDKKPRPFEQLLDRAAEQMAEMLGPEWL